LTSRLTLRLVRRAEVAQRRTKSKSTRHVAANLFGSASNPKNSTVGDCFPCKNATIIAASAGPANWYHAFALVPVKQTMCCFLASESLGETPRLGGFASSPTG
jgi:hypothetical protein